MPELTIVGASAPGPEHALTEAEQLREVHKLERLQAWHAALQDLAGAKVIVDRERDLRKEVAALYFPEPKEGTNKADLAAGYQLKLTYPVERKVDLPVLKSLSEQFKAHMINADMLVDYDPKLKKAIYDTLTEEQRVIFDQALVIKPGSISMEIVLPKKRGAA